MMRCEAFLFIFAGFYICLLIVRASFIFIHVYVDLRWSLLAAEEQCCIKIKNVTVGEESSAQ